MDKFVIKDGVHTYYYRTKDGVLVTSSVKPLPRSMWNSVVWHVPLSWSLWARNIRKAYKAGAR